VDDLRLLLGRHLHPGDGPATGLPLPGQGYGKHLLGGNHSRIEGAYVMYSPQSKYYYLFTSFGGLDANGAYNMRVARSLNPDGPYLDAKGTDMATVKANPALPLFDDASIAPHGQKLMGNHQFALAEPARAARRSATYRRATIRPITTRRRAVLPVLPHAASRAVASSTRSACTRCSSTRTAGRWWRRCATRRSARARPAVGRCDGGRCGRQLQDDQSRQGHHDGDQARRRPSGWRPMAAVSGAATGTWKHDGGNKVRSCLAQVARSTACCRASGIPTPARSS
jgi:hypothetical protein